jgi:hypothetical protein
MGTILRSQCGNVDSSSPAHLQFESSPVFGAPHAEGSTLGDGDWSDVLRRAAVSQSVQALLSPNGVRWPAGQWAVLKPKVPT